ncbi:DNA polymerase III subunit delta' [Bifidobacterium goeldii]|uniref:DNA polymerase III subunit delta n=1 Tax=Bifidobacterium goeldii TaxID=2306975 RepID=A0A430FLJ0_9BIFI|nr:DNA polymerase III subunit delta' [Bifidobacterium goeldii]RSX53611.1 DNA polymerase III subunit delta' [Bifidobacterium goeldii]
MSVWDSIIGQQAVVSQLQAIALGDPKSIAQSWLICGPPGSGRSHVARAFAAALESPDHGMSDEPTRVTEQILAGTHPDVSILATNKVTIGIDEVRELIGVSEQMPSTAPWRIIIIEDVDRMLERTTNVLLKEIEEPAEHTIWLLCAPSAQDVLPTIRSRTRIVNLAVPPVKSVAAWLEHSVGVEPKVAVRAARLAEGHIGIAKLYAKDERVMSDRDELIVGVLGLQRASNAVLLAGDLIDSAKEQAEADVARQAAAAEAEFRRINGLGEKDRIPPKLRGAYNAIAKKDEIKRQATRRSRDVLDRALNSIASVYRDVAVLQNNAESSVGLINLENRTAITELSVRLNRQDAVNRLEEIATARRRLLGNGNPTLVFEALFCALIPPAAPTSRRRR